MRSSPRKVNLLLKSIRGKKADIAIRDLSFARQRIAFDIKKTVVEAAEVPCAADWAAFLSAGVWPENCLVGENSPNLWPTISSDILIGINFLPLCIKKL